MGKVNTAMLERKSKEGFTVKRLIVIPIMLSMAVLPVYGQQKASIGIDAGWGNFDEDVTDANAWLAGFRAGYYALNWLELEGQFLGGRASEEFGIVKLHSTLITAFANGVFTTTARKVSPYGLIGIGGANLQVSSGISSFSDFGLAWQLAGGARFFVSKSFALRAEVGHLRENTFDDWNGHWRITGGVAWSFGER
jgi:opacity protein-like surface antigen